MVALNQAIFEQVAAAGDVGRVIGEHALGSGETKVTNHQGGGSVRSVALDGDSPHSAGVAGVVVERVVLDASVVPHHHRSGLPLHPACEAFLDGVSEQELKESIGFRLVQTDDSGGECAVDVERLRAGLRVGTDNRVLDGVVCVVDALGLHCC